MNKNIQIIFWLIIFAVVIAINVLVWSQSSYNLENNQLQVSGAEIGVDRNLLIDHHDPLVYFLRAEKSDNDYNFFEYPQLAQAYINGLRFLSGDDYLVFQRWLILFNSIFLVISIWLVIKIVKHINLRFPVWLVALPSFLFFSFNRFDILVLAAVLAGIYFLINDHWNKALIFLAIGFLLKWYPILFLPLFIFYAIYRAKSTHEILKGLSILVAMVVAAFSYSLFSSGLEATLAPYLFHLGRDVERGSYINYLPWQSFSALGVYFLLQFSGAILAPFYFARATHRGMSPETALIRGMILAVCTFIIFGKFYSMQFIVWFLPLIAIVAGPFIAILMVIFDLLNYIEYYTGYVNLYTGAYGATVYFSLLRYVILFLTLYLIFRPIRFIKKHG